MDILGTTKIETSPVTNARPTVKPITGSEIVQSRRTEEALSSDSVALSIAVGSNTRLNNSEIRGRINHVILNSNSVKETTDNIGSIIESLAGLTELAEKSVNDPGRVSVLQKEAETLAKQLDNLAPKTTPLNIDEISSPVNDPVYKKLTQLNNALENLIHDEDKKNIGVNLINFSTAEAIVSTRENVLRAQATLEELIAKNSAISKEINVASIEADIALQNSQAANSSVRDLDSALKLAEDMSNYIKNQSKDTLEAVNTLSSRSLDLLK